MQAVLALSHSMLFHNSMCQAQKHDCDSALLESKQEELEKFNNMIHNNLAQISDEELESDGFFRCYTKYIQEFNLRFNLVASGVSKAFTLAVWARFIVCMEDILKGTLEDVSQHEGMFTQQEMVEWRKLWHLYTGLAEKLSIEQGERLVDIVNQQTTAVHTHQMFISSNEYVTIRDGLAQELKQELETADSIFDSLQGTYKKIDGILVRLIGTCSTVTKNLEQIYNIQVNYPYKTHQEFRIKHQKPVELYPMGDEFDKVSKHMQLKLGVDEETFQKTGERSKETQTYENVVGKHAEAARKGNTEARKFLKEQHELIQRVTQMGYDHHLQQPSPSIEQINNTGRALGRVRRLDGKSVELSKGKHAEVMDTVADVLKDSVDKSVAHSIHLAENTTKRKLETVYEQLNEKYIEVVEAEENQKKKRKKQKKGQISLETAFGAKSSQTKKSTK